jgi:nucleotide-binding universal stress UspA family protein
MYQTILVPLDGSPFAERALPYVEALAQAGGARLVLVSAAHADANLGSRPADAPVATIGEATTYLAGVAERLTGHGLTAPIETVVLHGGAVDGILGEVTQRAVDLVAMGTHGRTGIGRALFGSIADQVLRRATAPVLLASPASERRWPLDRAVRILVPLDGSDFSEAALPAARALAGTLAAGPGADVRLLRVVEPAGGGLVGQQAPAFMSDPAAALAAADEYLESLAVAFRSEARAVSVDASAGRPAETIAAAARDEAADVIVMATHGRGGLARVVLGSVAFDVLRRVTVPVLFVRPEALHPDTEPPVPLT